jgi:glycerol-3-phosphate dehydrogenase
VKDILADAGLDLPQNPAWEPGLPRVLRTRDHAGAELEALVARDAAFGHMVCRCEGVSEAEVVEAIRKGHTTLDGIKYYTRAGMGRCQGGFCTYRIMRIISRETGLPLEKVTRHGPGSELVVGRLGDDGNAPGAPVDAPGAPVNAPGAPV